MDFLPPRFPEHQYVAYKQRLQEVPEDEINEADVVFDCTDDFETQQYIDSKWGHKCVRLGSNKNHYTVRYPSRIQSVWDVSNEEQQRCGVTVPQYLHIQVIAAVIGSFAALENVHITESETIQ